MFNIENENNLPEIQLSLGEETLPQLIPETYEAKPNDADMLSAEEKNKVTEFAKTIDLKNSSQILQYGVTAQKKISDFSESALSRVRTKDTGEIGNMLTSLTTELKGFTVDSEPKKGLLGILKKSGDQLSILKTRYSSVETNINRITDSLEEHKIQLIKDISMLDKMYELNLAYFKELTMYIIAGRERLDAAENTELPALKRRAQQSGLQQDAQEARDFEEMCNRFDKKLHDLDITRTISMQMAPQIRLVQNNDNVLVEKIQTSLVNTIPLWKNQMTIALGIIHSQKALNAQRAVTDMTNELLKKNADILKTSTVETAREAERSVVDIETIKYTNQQLISTIEEVIQIQETGRQNRRAAESELTQIENELKRTLLSVSR